MGDYSERDYKVREYELLKMEKAAVQKVRDFNKNLPVYCHSKGQYVQATQCVEFIEKAKKERYQEPCLKCALGRNALARFGPETNLDKIPGTQPRNKEQLHWDQKRGYMSTQKTIDFQKMGFEVYKPAACQGRGQPCVTLSEHTATVNAAAMRQLGLSGPHHVQVLYSAEKNALVIRLSQKKPGTLLMGFREKSHDGRISIKGARNLFGFKAKGTYAAEILGDGVVIYFE